MQPKKADMGLQTENVRWDLSCFYKGINDPQIDEDARAIEVLMREFNKKFKGKLDARLGTAIRSYIEIEELGNKLLCYVYLTKALDEANEHVKTKMDELEKMMSRAGGECLAFFDIELAALSEKQVWAQAKKDKTVAFHIPWIAHKRKNKPHLLSEEVESALAKRSPFGPDSWSKFYREEYVLLRFTFEGKELDLNKLLHVLETAQEQSRRAKALRAFNKGLGDNFARLSTQTLNMVVGLKQVEDRERKYKHPMVARNKDNGIPDEAVEALHEAVSTDGARIAQRFYTLKGAMLGIKPLLWSDRNAPLPFEKSEELIPYPEAIKLVLNAYGSFSPTLRDIIERMIVRKHIDAPCTEGKSSGAFNMPIVLPGGSALGLTLLNFLGTERDVMTLAHELGHGVHNVLAGETQGALMQHAPIALAETASVFGEMTTFNFLKQKVAERNNPEELLALNMGKLSDMVNTVIRQISFSLFEREIHGSPRRLSVEEYCNVWKKVTETLYGKDGEVFAYKDHEYLWAYIPHFHRPFYVYGYAFGELLTQSLYASQEKFGKEEFENMYLDLLRAGNSKDPKKLLKPFGLDPTDPDFWKLGLGQIEKLLAETETLFARYKK